MARIAAHPLAACLLLAASMLLNGCASTSLVNQWKSPEFKGPPLTKIMVMGVSTQPGPRRIFEEFRDKDPEDLHVSIMDAHPNEQANAIAAQALSAELLKRWPTQRHVSR